MATLIRCSVGVECNGKALHADKSAKVLGVEVAAPGNSPLLRVMGMKREIRFVAQDVQQISDSKIGDGRLAFVAKGGLRVILTKAQPTQLQFLLTRLRGGTAACPDVSGGLGGGLYGRKAIKPEAMSRPVASPASAEPLLKAPRASSDGEVVTQPLCAPRVSLARMDDIVLKQVVAYCSDAALALARLAESCSSLESFVCEHQQKFRLNPSCAAVGGIAPRDVVARLERWPVVKELRLEGWAQLTPGETGPLAQVLLKRQLKILCLRGCKALSDAAVKRLLEACPHVEILDLLEIPRLSNNALAVPFRALRVLAAGCLGKPGVGERPGSGSKYPVSLTLLGAQASIGGGPPRKKAANVVNFTSGLLTRLAQGQPAGEKGETSSSPLTHLVLANCTEIEVLPRLPRSLLHLDLRGANLQVPAAAIPGWKPFASCSKLEVLCLGGNALLSSEAVLACITSLEASALRVLDLSETRADMHTVQHLASNQRKLTHLRMSGCTALGMMAAPQLERFLRGLPCLEVLDISCCYLDEDLLPRPSAIAQPASTPASIAPALRLLGVGQLGARPLETIRRSLSLVAPGAHAVGGSLDIFGSYGVLPPRLQ